MHSCDLGGRHAINVGRRSGPMSPVIITLLVLLGVGLLLAGSLMYIYSGLGVARNRFKNAFAQIDVQLKRRYELIPNLVKAVKGYMGHERETLDAVIKARNSAMAAEQKVAANPSDPAAMRELNQAEAQLGGILGRLFALSEAYPDLKANQNMLALQEELSSTENKIAFARQAFNDAATDYNIRREVFPAVKVAGMFGFKEAALLETADTERAAPRVSFQNPGPATALCVPCSQSRSDHGHRFLSAAGLGPTQDLPAGGLFRLGDPDSDRPGVRAVAGARASVLVAAGAAPARGVGGRRCGRRCQRVQGGPARFRRPGHRPDDGR